MPDTTYLLYDPNDGWQGYSTLDAAEDAFDYAVDAMIPEADEAWHEDAETVALYRTERIRGVRLVPTGEEPREGFDEVMALEVIEEPPAADPGESIAVCLECGEQTRCDEDRCCPTCGRDLFLLAPGESADLLVEMAREMVDEAAADPALLASANRALVEEVERLRAEVERLRRGEASCVDDDGVTWASARYWRAANAEACKRLVEARNEAIGLRAEVERLRAARDAALAEQADDDAEWEAIQAMPREELCAELRAEGIDPEIANSSILATVAQVHRIVGERDSARALARTLLLCARSGDVIPQDLPEWMGVDRG